MPKKIMAGQVRTNPFTDPKDKQRGQTPLEW